jgi:predicted ArsR family transcriptional regulator
MGSRVATYATVRRLKSVTDLRPLTDLLGATRARIVTELQTRAMTAGQVATALSITPAATRRHLAALAADGLVQSETVRDGSMGRPNERWSLAPRGKRLFPDRSAEFATDVLDHLEAVHGRAAVLDLLRARADQQAARYADQLADVVDPADRARRLADALSADGFAARVEEQDDRRTLTLLQSHCAIEGIAREHPEICAHEAASFSRLLGTPAQAVKVSRRQTIATGAAACVCRIDLPDHTPARPELESSDGHPR